jgi:hypothetical protein
MVTRDPALPGDHHRCRRPGPEVVDPTARLGVNDQPAQDQVAQRRSPSANRSASTEVTRCRRYPLVRRWRSKERRASAKRQLPRLRRRRPQHTADVCPVRSSTRRHALPRRRPLHSFRCRSGLIIRWRFGTRQCCIVEDLLPKAHCCSRRSMTAKLLSNPRRERNPKVVDDWHNIIWNADRLIRHVRMIHTYMPNWSAASVTVRHDHFSP